MLHRQLSTTYRAIEAKYAMSWECAELLVELGGGPPPPPPTAAAATATATTQQQPPSASTSMSASMSLEQSQSTITPSTHGHPEVRRSRERAVTLGADEVKPPVIPVVRSVESDSQAWRASTGRHDLSHRQLLLLRDMIGGGSDYPTARGRISEEALNREWHWGGARSSSVTLPSEGGSSHRDSILGLPGSSIGHGQEVGGLKKRKSTRLGMRGLRDMLKSLRKSVSQNQVKHRQPPPPLLPEDLPRPPLPHTPASSTSVALTDSSMGLPQEIRDRDTGQRRRAKTSAGPESVKSLRETHPNSPYIASASVGHRSSPRRPSLASIFRLGQKSSRKSSSQSGSGYEYSVHDDKSSGVYTEEEEWDKVESSELPSPQQASTLKGMRNWSPYSNELPLDSVSISPGRALTNGSRSSIWESSSQAASASLPSASSSNVSQSYLRTTKLSDVKELVEKEGDDRRHHRRRLSKPRRESQSSHAPSPSPKRPMSRGGRRNTGTTGSLRSPPSAMSSPSYHYLPELDSTGFSESPLSLAMTPENIRPLLENAKEVHARCSDCNEELRQLLAVRTTIVAAA